MNWMFERALSLLVSAIFVATLGSCGSGAVSAPPATDPAAGTPIAVSPPAADIFPDLPTTFTVTGGKPAYQAFSSNSAALPIDANVVGATFTAIAKPVTVDTPVDITVRDAANISATAKATVRPSTLNNQVTFTPLGPTGTGCGTGLCSGGDAQVVVKAVLNGIVLRARPIRFDVYQGNFLIATPGSGTLVSSLTINTDEQGEAVVRVVATASSPTQVATLQSTDVTSGLTRRYNFNIIQTTSGAGVVSSLPSGTIAIKGAKGAIGQDGLCPIGARVDFYVYGGTPPYTIASPLPQVLTPISSSVTSSGGNFGVVVNGCGKASMIVTDSRGLTIETAAIDAQQGDKGDAAVTTTTSLTATPPFVDLSCGQSASIVLTGNASYNATLVQPVSSTLLTVSPLTGTISTTQPGTMTFTRSNSGAINPGNGGSSTPPSISVNLVSGTIVRTVVISLIGGSTAGTGVQTCP